MTSKEEQIAKAKAELDAVKNLESSKLKAEQEAKNKIAEDKAKALKAEQEAKEQEAKEQVEKNKPKIKKGEFLNPLKNGVSYELFLEALGTKTVAEYCKGKLTENEINWITNEIKIYKSIKTKK